MEILTIRDIARLARVSVSTVSRVLNGRPDVSEKTRAAVLQVVQKTNFTQNSNAKNLKQRNSEIASIIVRGRQNSFLTDVAERMISFGNQSKARFALDFIDEQGDEFEAAHRQFAERKIEGIVFLGSSTAGKEREIRALPLPCVFATVDTSALRCEGVSSVSVDDRLSARMAVDYLLDCGHRKIAVMGGRREVDDGIGQRYQGVLQSFEARSLAFDERLYVESHFTMGCAYERALAFVRSGLECTAMFCMSDTMAIGAIKAFSEFGLRVPDDISVIGFDNIALARFLTPTLSTVSQPAQLIAEKSVELISRLIHDPSDTENVIVPSRLVQGGTVRRLDGQEPPTRESARESA